MAARHNSAWLSTRGRICLPTIVGAIGREYNLYIQASSSVAQPVGTPELAHGLVLAGAPVTITPAIGFMVEAVLAFFLVTVVLSTAVAGRTAHLAPVAIGLTLVFNILMGGALTGAAFNPARALGPMIVTGNLGDAWLYGLAPIVGAIIAAVVHLGLSALTDERPAAAAAPAE